MGYYSPVKRNKVLIPATTQVKLEDSMKPNTKGHILYDSIYMKCQAGIVRKSEGFCKVPADVKYDNISQSSLSGESPTLTK